MRIREHGFHYHVIAKCNNSERLLLGHADRKKLLKLLQHYMERHVCELFNYVIMPSHVHLLLTTTGKGRLNHFMHDFCLSYSHYFNKKHARNGHLWRHPYFSKVVEDDLYALICLRYIDKNPQAAGSL